MRFDYNTPVDNINIVEMLIPYHPLNVYTKAFQIEPNIFIMPEARFGGYDVIENYLAFDRYGTVQAQQQFMDYVDGQLEQIKSGVAGKKLIEQLSNLAPIPNTDNAQGTTTFGDEGRTNLGLSIQNFDPNEGYFQIRINTSGDIENPIYSYKKVGHVLIMGLSPGNISRGAYNEHSSLKGIWGNGFGSGSIISIDPVVTIKVERTQNFQPPFSGLLHELCHSRQALLDIEYQNAVTALQRIDQFGRVEVSNVPVVEAYVTNSVDRYRIDTGQGLVYLPGIQDPIIYNLQTLFDMHRSDYDYMRTMVSVLAELDPEGWSIKSQEIHNRLVYRENLVGHAYTEITTEDMILADSLTALSGRPTYEVFTERRIMASFRRNYLDNEFITYRVNNPIHPDYTEAERLESIPSCSLRRNKRGIGSSLFNGLFLCRPGVISDDELKIYRKKKQEPLTIVKRKAKNLVEDFMKKRQVDNIFKPQFVDSYRIAKITPRSQVVIFKKTTKVLKQALKPSRMDALEIYNWGKNLIHVFDSDADDFTKASAALGIIPVVGDILGIIDDIRLGNAEQAIIGSFVLGALVTGAVIGGPVGVVIGAVVGIVFAIINIKSIIEDFINYVKKLQNLADPVNDFIGYRNESWKYYIVQVAKKEILPKMEEMYRIFESNARESLEIAVAVLEEKARLTVEKEPDEEAKKKILYTAHMQIEEMYDRYDDMLKEVAAKSIRDSKDLLHKMVREYYNQNFKKDSEEIIEGRRAKYVEEYHHLAFSAHKTDQKRELVNRKANEIFDNAKTKVKDTSMSLEDLSWLDECFEGLFWPEFINYSLPLLHISNIRAKEEFPDIANIDRIGTYTVDWSLLDDLPTELLNLLRVEIVMETDFSQSGWHRRPNGYESFSVPIMAQRIVIPRKEIKNRRNIFNYSADLHFRIRSPQGVENNETFIHDDIKKIGETSHHTYTFNTNGRANSKYAHLLPKSYYEYILSYNPSKFVLDSIGNELVSSNYFLKQSQKWKFKKHNDGTYLIRNTSNIGILSARGQTEVKFVVKSSEEFAEERWNIEIDDQGYQIRNYEVDNRFIGMNDSMKLDGIFGLIESENPNTYFNFIKEDSVVLKDGGIYRLFSEAGDYVLSLPFGISYTNEALCIWRNYHYAELWILKLRSNGVWYLRNIHSGKFIDFEPGDKLIHQNDVHHDHMDLDMNMIKGNVFMIVSNKKNNYAIDIAGNVIEPGRILISYQKKETKNQEWRFEPFPTVGIFYNILNMANWRKINSTEGKAQQGDNKAEINYYKNEKCLFRFELQEEGLYYVLDNENKLLRAPYLQREVIFEILNNELREEFLWEVSYDTLRGGWNIINKISGKAVQALASEGVNTNLIQADFKGTDSDFLSQSWMIAEPEAYGIEKEDYTRYIVTHEDKIVGYTKEKGYTATLVSDLVNREEFSQYPDESYQFNISDYIFQTANKGLFVIHSQESGNRILTYSKDSKTMSFEEIDPNNLDYIQKWNVTRIPLK
ncbi:hypothetical protein IQ37_17040 [Chryseobacterium piperi]|uniref:Uncharacterized protein n=1 Tax=Chryseobacterium piperi TaxID=558152 RepID=A0A086ALZ4_9FLAO|nr:M91 family zinc metallopeptidase [Chryseobacterium piperi]ASW73949.2 hypothetical protein CJF12_06355 [Chryseobacterium piperi]KFF17708.1 hypothetical protein IQ37_17040 [Chryseobacterium piperi]